MSEALEASVFEWKLEQNATAYGVTALEETIEGWILAPAETRLVHRGHARWLGCMPLYDGTPKLLEGHLIRLRLP